MSNLVLAWCASAASIRLSIVFAGAVVAMVGLTLALVGVTASRAIFRTIQGCCLVGMATAGGFFGPTMVGWIKGATESFTVGLLAMAAILLFTTLVVLPRDVLGHPVFG